MKTRLIEIFSPLLPLIPPESYISSFSALNNKIQAFQHGDVSIKYCIQRGSSERGADLGSEKYDRVIILNPDSLSPVKSVVLELSDSDFVARKGGSDCRSRKIKIHVIGDQREVLGQFIRDEKVRSVSSIAAYNTRDNPFYNPDTEISTAIRAMEPTRRFSNLTGQMIYEFGDSCLRLRRYLDGECESAITEIAKETATKFLEYRDKNFFSKNPAINDAIIFLMEALLSSGIKLENQHHLSANDRGGRYLGR